MHIAIQTKPNAKFIQTMRMDRIMNLSNETVWVYVTFFHLLLSLSLSISVYLCLGLLLIHLCRWFGFVGMHWTIENKWLLFDYQSRTVPVRFVFIVVMNFNEQRIMNKFLDIYINNSEISVLNHTALAVCMQTFRKNSDGCDIYTIGFDVVLL